MNGKRELRVKEQQFVSALKRMGLVSPELEHLLASSVEYINHRIGWEEFMERVGITEDQETALQTAIAEFRE